MSKQKEARPGAGTLERAEAGSGLATSNSHQDCNTVFPVG